MTDEKMDLPPTVNGDGERAKEAEGVASRPSPLFDVEQLLRAADAAARFGLSPAALLTEAVRAEARLPERECSLASLVENNDPSRMVDVFESPTFRKRFRELRIRARTVGTGPATYANLAEGVTPGVTHLEMKIDELVEAVRELKAIGRALAVVGPNAPLRRKRRFEEMVLVQREDGSSVLDREGLPIIVSQSDAVKGRAQRWQPVSAIERNCLQFTTIVKRAIQESKRRRREDEILTALEKGNGTPPTFRPKLAALLAEQRTRSPGMRAESIALCWAFGVDVNRSAAERLRRRQADRGKKIRGREGRPAKRNVP